MPRRYKKHAVNFAVSQLFCIFAKGKLYEMTRRLFTLIFAVAMTAVVPVTGNAGTAVEIIDNDYQNIVISVKGSTLHVVGAAGQTLYIYNVAGVRVMTVKVDGSDRRYELNFPKGCYIVKVGNTARKISIK